jgi:hypothetical protein
MPPLWTVHIPHMPQHAAHRLPTRFVTLPVERPAGGPRTQATTQATTQAEHPGVLEPCGLLLEGRRGRNTTTGQHNHLHTQLPHPGPWCLTGQATLLLRCRIVLPAVHCMTAHSCLGTIAIPGEEEGNTFPNTHAARLRAIPLEPGATRIHLPPHTAFTKC